MKQLLVVFLFMICFSVHQAHACNSLDFTLDSGNFNLTSNNNPTLNLTVTRNNQNNGCTFFIAIGYGTASTFSTRALQLSGGYKYPVQIYKDSTRTLPVKALADVTGANDVVVGTFADGSGGKSTVVSFYPSIDPALYSRFGNYSENFIVSLYEYETNGSATLKRTRTQTLTYTQPKRTDVSLVETGGTFNSADTSQTMNFGALTTGASQGFDLIVGHNAGYRLTITSTNSGKIKHSTQSTVTIPYAFSLNNVVRDLSTGSVILPAVTGVSPSGGTRLPVAVTIGSTTGKPSGNYSDTVTFSVVSTE